MHRNWRNTASIGMEENDPLDSQRNPTPSRRVVHYSSHLWMNTSQRM